MVETDIDTLPDDIEALKALLLEREQHFVKTLATKEKALKNKDRALEKKALIIDKKTQRVEFLEEYIRLMKYRHYGASSERYAPQADLFNEA